MLVAFWTIFADHLEGMWLLGLKPIMSGMRIQSMLEPVRSTGTHYWSNVLVVALREASTGAG